MEYKFLIHSDSYPPSEKDQNNVAVEYKFLIHSDALAGVIIAVYSIVAVEYKFLIHSDRTLVMTEGDLL